MTNVTLIRTAALAALVVVALVSRSTPATAADPGPLIVGPAVQIHGDRATQFMPLGVGKSVVIDLPGDIKDVLVADPKIANAVVRTSRRAYIIGVAIGQTNVYFFDSEGRQLVGFDIAVTRDLNGLRAALKQALPGLDIRVEGLGEGLVLTGLVLTIATWGNVPATLIGSGLATRFGGFRIFIFGTSALVIGITGAALSDHPVAWAVVIGIFGSFHPTTNSLSDDLAGNLGELLPHLPRPAVGVRLRLFGCGSTWSAPTLDK